MFKAKKKRFLISPKFFCVFSWYSCSCRTAQQFRLKRRVRRVVGHWRLERRPLHSSYGKSVNDVFSYCLPNSRKKSRIFWNFSEFLHKTSRMSLKTSREKSKNFSRKVSEFSITQSYVVLNNMYCLGISASRRLTWARACLRRTMQCPLSARAEVAVAVEKRPRDRPAVVAHHLLILSASPWSNRVFFTF